MVVFPYCKINLGLHVVNKRPDGFHDLETVFYPIRSLHDALEVLPQSTGDIDFTITGLSVDGPTDNNLCTKAYRLLKADFPQLPPVRMHLHKAIPMGAGLGGGSADGAFTLILLNNKFRLGISPSQLEAYALQLGSDCPFFIFQKPCFATGRGEKMEDLPLQLNGCSLVLINPDIHINTGWAFGQITPQPAKQNLKDAILQPIETWHTNIYNDFQVAAVQAHPIIGSLIETLYQNGATYAAMSGTGSTVFGIFTSEKVPSKKLAPEFFELTIAL